jgi:hypothetical protein
MTHAVATATASRFDHPFGGCGIHHSGRCRATSFAATIVAMDVLSLVYTAAFAASGSRVVAEQVAERVIVAQPAGDPTSLAERAVLLALRSSPACAFASMCEDDREAVALARLTGATTGRVASVLGIAPEEVRARMRRGLLSAGGAPRTPRPRPGSGSAASPGRA